MRDHKGYRNSCYLGESPRHPVHIIPATIHCDLSYTNTLTTCQGAPGYQVFGEPGDSNILGIVTLEVLGYVMRPEAKTSIFADALIGELR